MRPAPEAVRAAARVRAPPGSAVSKQLTDEQKRRLLAGQGIELPTR